MMCILCDRKFKRKSFRMQHKTVKFILRHVFHLFKYKHTKINKTSFRFVCFVFCSRVREALKLHKHYTRLHIVSINPR